MRKKAQYQSSNGRVIESDEMSDPFLKLINLLSKPPKYDKYYNRAVLNLKHDEDAKNMENCVLDSVELNSLRVNFLVTIN